MTPGDSFGDSFGASNELRKDDEGQVLDLRGMNLTDDEAQDENDQRTAAWHGQVLPMTMSFRDMSRYVEICRDDNWFQLISI